MVGNRKVRDLSRARWALGVFAVACSIGLVGFGCGGQSVGTATEGDGGEGSGTPSSGGSTGAPSPPDCVKLCQKGVRAGCLPADEDCEGKCLWDDFAVQGTGCHREYSDTLECSAELDDICTVRSSCNDELAELRECYKDSCAKKPADYCVGLN